MEKHGFRPLTNKENNLYWIQNNPNDTVDLNMLLKYSDISSGGHRFTMKLTFCLAD